LISICTAFQPFCNLASNSYSLLTHIVIAAAPAAGGAAPAAAAAPVAEKAKVEEVDALEGGMDMFGGGGGGGGDY